MSNLSKSDFISAFSRKRARVDLPELGEGKYMTLQELSSGEYLLLQRSKGDKVNESNIFDYLAFVIALTAIDDKGVKLFDHVNDMQDIQNLSNEIILKLGIAALELSGIQTKEQSQKKRVSKKTR